MGHKIILVRQSISPKGLFCTYDMAKRDADGDYHIIGRVDDIKRIRGVWQIIPEIENAMVSRDTPVILMLVSIVLHLL